jgi:hypothetical protein
MITKTQGHFIINGYAYSCCGPDPQNNPARLHVSYPDNATVVEYATYSEMINAHYQQYPDYYAEMSEEQLEELGIIVS